MAEERGKLKVLLVQERSKVISFIANVQARFARFKKSYEQGRIDKD